MLVNDHRARPQGLVRLTVPESAAACVVAPRIGEFLRLCPDVELEISVNSGFLDIVKERFDAGIRLGESVGVGMTSVRVSDMLRSAVVATPGYWALHGRPDTPADLARHRCINRRYAPGRALHRWHFARKAEVVEIPCRGPLILDADWLMRDAALQGAGVAYLAEDSVEADITAGRLERVLDDWCPPIFAYYLYHSSQQLPSAGLSALIEAL
ncbi:MAG: LysR substrate-binding domain-containing protein, partial [Pseudorhizobium sp.]